MPVKSITLDGIQYNIDDCIYVASENTNEAHYLARIVDFVEKDDEMAARVAWFYRAADVSRRRKPDARLLVASMNTDTTPVSSIRGKCQIQHCNDIAKQKQAYAALPDAFYYDQLHDRYTMRLYDVVPIELVNLPEALETYFQNYRFILVEAGKSSDFAAKKMCSECDV